MKSSNHLGLFAKFWQPGKVKTRLALKLGHDRAAQVYFEFLVHLLSQLKRAGQVRTIVFQPAERENFFANLCRTDWDLVPQTNGDLGVKLKSFFEESFNLDSAGASGFKKVVVIGSDCPLIDAKTIEEAFRRLDDQPVVIGPSSDGGYYLIGMNEFLPEIFDDIAWSTDRVLNQTVEFLQFRQIGFELLAEMRDIDHWHDLAALIGQLRDKPATAGNRSLLKTLESILFGVQWNSASEALPGGQP